MTLRGLRRQTRAATALDFALLAMPLITVTFGTIGVGLLTWTMGGLQSVAAMSARCGALGVLGTTGCVSVATTQSYAVAQAGVWVIGGAIAASDVTATSGATTCKNATGKFYKVSISSTFFGTNVLPPPLGGKTITVTACYPMA